MPIVVTGFEPLDILEGVRRAVRQLERGEHTVDNAYARAVRPEGNPAARAMLEDVFEITDRAWRGIGVIPDSGWRLSAKYRDHDAEHRFSVSGIQTAEPAECRSGEVLQGLLKPHECEAFGTLCTPAHPWEPPWSPARAPARRTTSTGVWTCPPPRRFGRRAPLSDTTGLPVTAALDIEAWTCPAPLRDRPRVVMGHGGGGVLSAELVQQIFAPAFGGEVLAQMGDAAVLSLGGARLAFSTDSYVVRPLFFPGGSIGDLAVNGTVNDLAMSGARAAYLSCGFILEEGVELDVVTRVSEALGAAARTAGVEVATGDTKVVEAGHGDGIYINTAGIGLVPAGVDLRPQRVVPGDVVIVSGAIGVHGVAVMSVREGLEFGVEIASDCAALGGLVEAMLAVTPDLHVLRDPTRGGLAASLNEIAAASGTGVVIRERDVPVPSAVANACAILGLDPMYIANEGKLVAFVPREHADAVLEAMRAHPLGADSVIIGEAVEAHPGMVVARTGLGERGWSICRSGSNCRVSADTGAARRPGRPGAEGFANAAGVRTAGPAGPRRSWRRRPWCRWGVGSGPGVRCRVCPSRPRRRTPHRGHRGSRPCRPGRTSSPRGTSSGPDPSHRPPRSRGRNGGRSGCPAGVCHPHRATSRAARGPGDGWGPFRAVTRRNVVASTWSDLPFHGQGDAGQVHPRWVNHLLLR